MRVQSLSTALLVQKPTQLVCIPSADTDVNFQDEQWVALTRNLTLLPVQCPIEHDTTWSNDEENTMVCLLITSPRPSS